jgi:lysophospholipase L1-like esterase
MPRLIGSPVWAVLLLALAASLLVACGGDDDASTADPTGATATPTPTLAVRDRPPGPEDAVTPEPGTRLLYLALGDSLSAGIGATDPLTTSWVPLVGDALGYEVINRGIPGDDSAELLNEGSLDDGIIEIESRATDANPANDVGAITLEIGGNDLLDIYFDLVIPGDCPSVVESLERPACVEALSNALTEYRENLVQILTRLKSAAGDTPIFLMTLYNPFSGGASHVDQIGVLALEGQDGTPFPTGLNDVIREQAAATGVHLVEWYELFLQKQSQYISQDLIHPNDTGHQVMANAVIAAMAAAGLP